MSDVIFEYKKSACCNFLGGNTDGFEISIKKEGAIIYREFDFDDNTLDIKEYQISKDSIEKIKEAIKINSEIFRINDKLDNGSLDGNANQFLFANEKTIKKICALNIQDSIDDGNKIRNEYLERYGENLRQERIVLKLFFEICNILKEEKLELDLYVFINNREDN